MPGTEASPAWLLGLCSPCGVLCVSAFKCPLSAEPPEAWILGPSFVAAKGRRKAPTAMDVGVVLNLLQV